MLITMHLCKNMFGLLTWENAGSLISRGFLLYLVIFAFLLYLLLTVKC